ncbi:MAG TPA: shikimate kinase [Paludibacteraceae bacterium]|jgi:shikimate kinase|nr:shikimate kinase [Paludibacteraceae bacterium]HQB68741.1 shikimate kinase [Paludibacteraceae bacterium]HRS67292.1 shikimate kinase [Paludibacteraceae bacterium]
MKRIFLVGFMGCGKTATGKRLAEQIGWQLVDLDKFIENRYCKTIPQLFAEWGEEEFRLHERAALLEVSDYEQVVISTGGGAACFHNNMDDMNARGLTVYLYASPEELVERLSHAKVERPLLKGKTHEELALYIRELLEKREVSYKQAQLTIHTSPDNSFSHVEKLISLLPKN